MQRRRRAAAAEKVGSAAPELAGARACQHEALILFVDEELDLIEQHGELLDLIDDDDLVSLRQLLAKAGGAAAQL